MAISTRFYRILFASVPFLLLLSGFKYEITAIKFNDQGHFIYTLDDPYIHLSLAERIAQGHYGINFDEVSAPSSSILWPFLLVPFARTTFFEYIPLVINLLAALASLFIFMKIIQTAFEGVPDLYARAAAAWMAIFLIPATNLIGLAFTGMEHSLQVALCAGIVLGLIQVARDKPTPRWLIALLIVAPAVRYECLAVSVPALVMLFASRRWKAAWIGLGGMLVPIAAFSLFLHANQVGWLPNSVIAKVSFAAFKPTPNFIADHLKYNLELRQGNVLGVMMIILGSLPFVRRNTAWKERLLALLGAGAILAHLSAGQFGWWDRYEIYMIVTGVLLIIYLARGFFKSLFWSAWNQRSWVSYPWPFVNLALLGWMAWTVGKPDFKNFEQTPTASANIYEQQYQMHRFVVDYLHAPVAVNDLGFVAYRNPDYVLDLWGLASNEALANRTGEYGGYSWMNDMVLEHKVQLVMIYDDWFGFLPHQWVRVSRLYLGSKGIVTGSDVVSFYVTDSSDADAMKARLAQFQPSLPPGVRMEISP